MDDWQFYEKLSEIHSTLEHILEILSHQAGVPQHLWTDSRRESEAANQQARLDTLKAINESGNK